MKEELIEICCWITAAVLSAFGLYAAGDYNGTKHTTEQFQREAVAVGAAEFYLENEETKWRWKE